MRTWLFLPCSRRHARLLPALVALLGIGVASPALAQGAAVPALQRPTVSDRDYTAALVGGGGAAFLLQWREAWPMAGDGAGGARTHWQLEGGLADAPGATSPRPFVGAGVARTLVRASAGQPLDAVWTAGGGVAWLDGGVVVRVPVGVSVGHTFEVEGGARVTPFAHPRLQVESRSCGERRCGASRGAVSLAFDVGADAQLTPQLGVRAAVQFSGGGVSAAGDRLALGMSWTPPGLKR